MESTAARLAQLNNTKDTLAKLQEERDLLKETYELYTQKVEESLISDQLAQNRVTSVRVASSPSLPVNPVSPNRLLNLAVALIGGIIAGLGLAFLLDYFDHGLKTPEDVDHYMGIPVLASFFNKGGQPLDRRQGDRLAVMVDSLQPSEGTPTIEVTSAVMGEDAGPVALLLAESFANNPEGKTLLIDLAGDVGRPPSSQYGVADVLTGQVNADDVFGGSDPLVIVGRGVQGEFPAYLWGSDRMRELLADLRRQFRYIVFNVDPVLSSEDAMKVSKVADGVVFSIKANATRREVVNRAVRQLTDGGATMAGAVLTQRTQTIPNAVYRKI